MVGPQGREGRSICIYTCKASMEILQRITPLRCKHESRNEMWINLSARRLSEALWVYIYIYMYKYMYIPRASLSRRAEGFIHISFLDSCLHRSGVIHCLRRCRIPALRFALRWFIMQICTACIMNACVMKTSMSQPTAMSHSSASLCMLWCVFLSLLWSVYK